LSRGQQDRGRVLAMRHTEYLTGGGGTETTCPTRGSLGNDWAAAKGSREGVMMKDMQSCRGKIFISTIAGEGATARRRGSIGQKKTQVKPTVPQRRRRITRKGGTNIRGAYGR